MKIKNLQIIRGGATILVIVGHITTISGNSIASDIVYFFHMPLFFILSGFLFGMKEMNHLSTWENVNEFLRKKLISLGLPYLFFSIAYIIFNSVLREMIHVHTDVKISDLLTFIYRPVAHYWYLWALIFMFICTSFVVKIMNKQPQYLLSVFGIVCTIIWCMCDLSAFGILNSCCKNMVFFIVGIFLGSHHQKILYSIRKIYLPISIIATVLFFIIMKLSALNIDVHINSLLWVINAFIGSIAFSGMLVFFSEKFKVLSEIMCYIGDKSWYIYLIHSYFTAFSRILMTKLLNTETGCYVIEMLSGTILPIIAGVIVAAICKRVKSVNFFFYPQSYLHKM